MSFRIGVIIFDKLTLLDFAGAHEILARIPGATDELISLNGEAISTDLGVQVGADLSFEQATEQASTFDLIFVPGGPGQTDLMNHKPLLNLLKACSAGGARMSSVCTGALLLASAGLLQGKRATTHWLSLQHLSFFGAEPISERIVIDGNVITAAGVSSGIDFALLLASEIAGEEVAKQLQLLIEYDPEPPFSCGSVKSAPDQRVGFAGTCLGGLLCANGCRIDKSRRYEKYQRR